MHKYELTILLASQSILIAPLCSLKSFGNFIFMYLVATVDSLYDCSRFYDVSGASSYIPTVLQLLMNSVQLVGQSSPNISIFGIECLFKCIFGLPQSLSLSFVCFNIGCKVVKFFLYQYRSTSTVDNLFLRDIEVIIIAYHITHQNNHSNYSSDCLSPAQSKTQTISYLIIHGSKINPHPTSTLATTPTCFENLEIRNQLRPHTYHLSILILSPFLTIPSLALENILPFSQDYPFFVIVLQLLFA